ncbi:glycine cleavage system H protein, mitochondrial [Senna tora]|uniref:Glycine cleavage system H protein, mitochondrial n=1 Tax=Senna tora TaxID=362788 RepID=A0A834WVS5_9FABA|nr:glycine cleavage system H protein, mitochondrial [Senna tora]
MWASSTANALKISLSCASRPHLSRCFSSVLDGLKYAQSHEWVKHEGPVDTLGITDHAQPPSLPIRRTSKNIMAQKSTRSKLMLNLDSTTIVDPDARIPVANAARPYMWNIGTVHMKVSSLSIGNRPKTIFTIAIRFRCDDTTPLLAPVVPDEYSRVAVSSWNTQSLTRLGPGSCFIISPSVFTILASAIGEREGYRLGLKREPEKPIGPSREDVGFGKSEAAAEVGTQAVGRPPCFQGFW